MWFKNVTLFQLTHPFRFSAESLNEKMAERSARKCGPLELSTIGWTPAVPGRVEFAHYADPGCIVIACKKTEKILPATVVREILQERIEEIEHTEGRDVRNKEKQRLREEVTVELLPRAFPKSRTTYAIIDPENGWLMIDSASRSRAEELTVLLRETLGSLEITNPETDTSPTAAMSQWLFHGTPPTGFTLDDECEITESDEPGGTIRCKNVDITAAAVRKHLENHSRVTKLALSWNDRISFVMDQDLVLRRINPLEVIDNLREEQDPTDGPALFEADLILFRAEITELLKRLFEVLGGES